MKKYGLPFLLFLFCISAHAQLLREQKKVIIDSVESVLNRYYVFPETAAKMSDHLRKQLATGKYDALNDEKRFAAELTADLYSIGHDKHVRVSYAASVLPAEEADPFKMTEVEKRSFGQWVLAENYGVNKLEILPGNIGYIDFKWFCGTEYGAETYTAAMNYIAHTDALIIDLRNCQGSMSDNVIPFLCSYFFETPTHINDFYWRIRNDTLQSWTYAVVPGRKYLDKPIYILTSAKTFSGAEELAYDLKNLKRAILIGEVTGGGANGGGDRRVTDHFSMFVPMGRAINPITKTNWEGTGVQPDTLIKSNRALYKARQIALQYLLKNSKDDDWKQRLARELGVLKEPVFREVRFTLEGFADAKKVSVAGSFNNWSAQADKLKRVGGKWVCETEVEPGTVTYKFVVDGRWILDPANKETKQDGDNINSVMKVQ
jgi:hypothetical protein